MTTQTLAVLASILCACKSSSGPAPTLGSAGSNDSDGGIVGDAPPSIDASGSAVDDLAKRVDSLAGSGLRDRPDPFETAPFAPQAFTGTLLRDGKLVDVSTLGVEVVLRTCPSDLRKGGIFYVRADKQLILEIDFDLPGPKRKIAVGDRIHQVHIYRGGRSAPEARTGHAFAHTLERTKLDIEFVADFGKAGRVQGRFVSGPPDGIRGGLSPRCEVN